MLHSSKGWILYKTRYVYISLIYYIFKNGFRRITVINENPKLSAHVHLCKSITSIKITIFQLIYISQYLCMCVCMSIYILRVGWKQHGLSWEGIDRERDMYMYMYMSRCLYGYVFDSIYTTKKYLYVHAYIYIYIYINMYIGICC
jgi:hypothetical protein